MKFIFVTTLLLTSALSAGPGIRASLADDSMKSLDQMKSAKLLNHIHHINQMEIKAGKLAKDKGVSADVKNYGQKMISEHQDADKKLAELSETKHFKLLGFAPADFEKVEMDYLDHVKGADFDTAYIEAMKGGHHHALGDLKMAADMTTDPQIKAFVQTMIPTVQQHEDAAKAIAK